MTRAQKQNFIFTAILVSPVVFLLAYPVIVLIAPRSPNRATVRNTTAVEIHDLQITLRTHGGPVILQETIPTLPPGESITFSHAENGLSADLKFVLDGQDFSHRNEYIDLWTGEGWMFAINADGSVAEGYDSVLTKQCD